MYYIESEKYHIGIQTDDPNSLQQAINKAGEILKSEAQLKYNCNQSSGKLKRDLYDSNKKCIGEISVEWSLGIFRVISRINYF